MNDIAAGEGDLGNTGQPSAPPPAGDAGAPQQPAVPPPNVATPPAPPPPVEYGEFKAPEGKELDQEGLKALTEIGKKYNWPQSQVQDIIDLQFKELERAQQAAAASSQQATENNIKQWETHLLNAPDIGNGDPKVLHAKLTEARAVLMAGEPSEDLLNFLSDTGLGSYPPLVNVFLKLHSKMAEDSLVTQTTTPAPGGDEGDIFERAGNRIYKNSP